MDISINHRKISNIILKMLYRPIYFDLKQNLIDYLSWDIFLNQYMVVQFSRNYISFGCFNGKKFKIKYKYIYILWEYIFLY